MSACKKCGTEKVNGRCGKCAEEHRIKYRNSHPYVSDRSSYNPEERKALYLAQGGYEQKKAAERYRADPFTHKERVDKWKSKNKGKVRVIRQNRRARIKACDGKLSFGLVDKLYKLQQGKCACCGVKLDGKYHLDHIMPLALGGAHEDGNMQLLTPVCNLRKNAKHPIDYMQSKGFLI
jgi:5-methylcytosine-specific restriction endonuclease McrA